MTGRLEEILEGKKNRQEAGRALGADERDAWVRSVSALLDTIETWLKPLAGKGYLRINRRTGAVREEAFGDYNIERLTIEFVDGQIVEVQPVGRYVLGADGRLDLKAGLHTTMIVRRGMDKWELAEREGRGKPKTWPLTRETFEELLAGIVEEA
jgi:hypothetical protein